jgi:hypothetical protein
VSPAPAAAGGCHAGAHRGGLRWEQQRLQQQQTHRQQQWWWRWQQYGARSGRGGSSVPTTSTIQIAATSGNLGTSASYTLTGNILRRRGRDQGAPK